MPLCVSVASSQQSGARGLRHQTGLLAQGEFGPLRNRTSTEMDTVRIILTNVTELSVTVCELVMVYVCVAWEDQAGPFRMRRPASCVRVLVGS